MFIKFMKNPTRITIALDEETANRFEKMKEETKLSQSELMRRALRFYHENKALIDNSGSDKMRIYADMLSSGEHIILDVDHWLLFLKHIESLPEQGEFWDDCKNIARSHAEQLSLKIRAPEDVLKRLEACNFFKLSKDSENNFTLLMGSEVPKKFIRVFLEEVFAGMGVKIDVKEDIAKLRIKTTELKSIV